MTLNLMAVTNGVEAGWAAIEYAAWLAKHFKTELSLLGIAEADDRDHPLEEMVSRAVSLLQREQVKYSLLVQNGPAEEVLADFARQHEDFLYALGPLGRSPLKHLLSGRSFRRMMAEIKAPILFVPSLRLPVRKLLVCMGGLEYSLTAEHLGMQVAQFHRASVTLLTVIPPIEFDYPEARRMQAKPETLLESDTLTGHYLRSGLEAAQQVGVEALVKIRQGTVVQEILSEIKAGEYDLVCMGSTYSSHGLRHFFTPNVTAEVAEASLCPLLTARYNDKEED
jgi:nucleotide-binding universal stress UspA family protein